MDDIITEDPQATKQAAYVSFPIAALQSDIALEETPPDHARRILQRCLAWHIANTKIDSMLFGELIDDVSAIEALAAEVATNYGKQRSLFPTALFRSAMNDWPYRKFAILAALYASIGQYDYRVVTREKIIAGSVGFSNQKEREAFGSMFEPITVNKLRTTLDHLEAGHLITRAKYNGRTTAYGRPKPHLNLSQQIQQRKARTKSSATSWLNALSPQAEKKTSPPPIEKSATKLPQETHDERHDRIARESLARQAASEQRNLRLYPPRQIPTSQSVVTPPKEPPTPEELELRRQQIMRLVGEK